MSPYKMSMGIVLLSITLASCSLFNPPPFPHQDIKWADREIVFKDLLHHMRSLEGTKVILGGEILSVKQSPSHSLLIVKDYPLGSEFHPDMDQRSRGDFAIETDQEISGYRYQKGRSIEVIGEVRAPAREAVDGKAPALIPMIRAHYMHAQSPPASRPDPVMEDPALIDPAEADPGYMSPGMMDPFMW